MDSNRALVDNFLNGDSNLSLPVMPSNYNNSNNFATNSNLNKPSTLDSHSETQGRGSSSNVNSVAHMQALQQRLFVLISEAQGIITQLQQYGCFPKTLQTPDASPPTNVGEKKINNEALGIPTFPPSSQNADPPPIVPKYQQQQSSSPKSIPWEAPPPDSYAANSPIDTAALWGSMAMMGTSPSQSNVASNFIDTNGMDRHTSFGKSFVPLDGAGPASGQDYINERQGSKINPAIVNPYPVSQPTNTPEYEADDAIEDMSGANHGPLNASTKEQIVYVEFKRKRIHKYTCHDPTITPGVYVLVDGDRGTDCGLVTRTVRWLPNGKPDITSMDECGIDEQKIKPGNGYVLRQATNEELDKLHNVLANAESVALKTCRQRCQEFGIDIKLIDAEYQFDMKKISFFYDSDRSIDFRALVRELYRTFGARIWMENVNPKVKNCMPLDSGTCSPTCLSTRESEVVNGNRHSHNSNRRK
ncbi:unnamed protein product [Phytomonas sp. EM1]|nr:unnamed protein product [Phytomonas sp. EM1]|eukprot:CCW64883.1 unnamed protein product [Phytomonas sp. isolate EM1]